MTKILLIYTGGTIGMIQDERTYALVPFDFTQVQNHVPELKRLEYELNVHVMEPPIDSSNMQPGIWIELVKIVERWYHKVDGFVILHGSDTMAYTASALSFLLQGLAKPVVLTGAQLPVGAIRTDAKENLITAIEIAAAKRFGAPRVPEVCIYFEHSLSRGNRSIKYSSAQFDAFASPNYPLLAEAGVYLHFNDKIIMQPKESIQFHKKLNCSIAVLKVFPGMPFDFAKAILNSKAKAIILEIYGNGNASTSKEFLSLIDKAIIKEKIIVALSQCKRGAIELGKYNSSKTLKEIGVVGSGDMSFEATLTKLMFLLGTKKDRREVMEELNMDLRGEITVGKW